MVWGTNAPQTRSFTALPGKIMKRKKVYRPGVRDGYDMWAASYDDTPNPLVALDRRYTLNCLTAKPAGYILDAGCGTGAHLLALRRAGSQPVGVDLSMGMLRIARDRLPGIPLAQANLNEGLPLARGVFDAAVCSLVSEHLTNLRVFFADTLSVLRAGGRLVFSAFHPEMAAAGVEANFEANGCEYRLGAEHHTVEDYVDYIHDAGFRDVRCEEYSVDAELVERIPRAKKYLGHPLLLIIQALHPKCSAV
jgi:SAM-dependent methyltransferase